MVMSIDKLLPDARSSRLFQAFSYLGRNVKNCERKIGEKARRIVLAVFVLRAEFNVALLRLFHHFG